jgi:hypothetical protein
MEYKNKNTKQSLLTDRLLAAIKSSTRTIDTITNISTFINLLHYFLSIVFMICTLR